MEFFSTISKIGLRTETFDLNVINSEREWHNFSASIMEIVQSISKAVQGLNETFIQINDTVSSLDTTFTSFLNSTFPSLSSGFSAARSLVSDFNNTITLLKNTKATKEFITIHVTNALNAQTAATVKTTIATKALAVAQGVATAATVVLKKALIATGIGAVVVLVGTLTAGLATLAGSLSSGSKATQELKKENDKLADSFYRLSSDIEENTRLHRERISTTIAESNETEKLINRLSTLIALEEVTTSQRQHILQLVRQLNNIMPELALYYDRETGELNKSLEAVKKHNEARITQILLNEKIAREAQIPCEIAKREEEINRIYKQRSKIVQELNELSIFSLSNIASFNPSYRTSLMNESNALFDMIQNLRRANRESSEELNNLRSEIDLATIAFENANGVLERYTHATQYAITKNSHQVYTVDQLTNSISRFEQAQNELNNINELSLRTIDDLIQNGYAQILQINKETGAIELNTEAYLKLTKARIDTQISSLQSDRQALTETIIREQQAVNTLTGYYQELALTQLNEAMSRSLSGEYEIRIAVLEQLRNNIGQTTQATGRAAVATISASEQALNGIVENLERRKFFEEITAAEIVDIWENSLDKFAEGTAERERVERELFTARRNLERDLYDERRDIFRNEMQMIDQRRQNVGLSFNEEIRMLDELRYNYADNAYKIEEIDRARFDAKNRMLTAQENTLQRIQDAEQRYRDAVSSRSSALINSALNASGINRLLVDSTEYRATAVIAAEERIAESTKQLNEVRNNSEMDFMERRQETRRLEEEIANHQIELAEARTQSEKTNAQLIAKSLQQQIYDMEEWARMTDYILSNTDITKEFLAEMQLLEPSAISELKVLYKSCNEELDNIAYLFGEMQARATDRAIYEMQDFRQEVNDEIVKLYNELNALIYEESPDVGKNMIQGMIDGAKSKSEELSKAIQNIMREAISACRETLDINSPSREFYKMGESSMDGYINAINKKTKSVVSAITEMITKAVYSAGDTEIEMPLTFGERDEAIYVSDMLDKKVNLFESAFTQIVRIVTDKLMQLSRIANNIMHRMMLDMNTFLVHEGFNTGRSFFEALGQGLISQEAALLRQAMSTASAIRSAFGNSNSGGFAPAGSFATGLLRVPYDNFPAVLHKNEMVLTAAQADEYRNDEQGNTTIIQHFHGVKERETGYAAYRGFQKAQLALGRF